MNLDKDDCEKFLAEMQKHSHPLHTDSEKLYRIVNGQYAPSHVNVQIAVEIGKQQKEQFMMKLPDGFHNSIEKRVKTMQQMQKTVVVQGKVIYDMEAIYLHVFS